MAASGSAGNTTFHRHPDPQPGLSTAKIQRTVIQEIECGQGMEPSLMRRLMKLDEQWKPMRQNVPPLKTEQSKKEGMPNHGLAQVWASFSPTPSLA